MALPDVTLSLTSGKEKETVLYSHVVLESM